MHAVLHVRGRKVAGRDQEGHHLGEGTQPSRGTRSRFGRQSRCRGEARTAATTSGALRSSESEVGMRGADGGEHRPAQGERGERAVKVEQCGGAGWQTVRDALQRLRVRTQPPRATPRRRRSWARGRSRQLCRRCQGRGASPTRPANVRLVEFWRNALPWRQRNVGAMSFQVCCVRTEEETRATEMSTPASAKALARDCADAALEGQRAIVIVEPGRGASAFAWRTRTRRASTAPIAWTPPSTWIISPVVAGNQSLSSAVTAWPRARCRSSPSRAARARPTCLPSGQSQGCAWRPWC